MPSLPEQILELVQRYPGKTDREIAEALRGKGAPQQPINQAARTLERRGALLRRRRSDGRIGNYTGSTDQRNEPTPSPGPRPSESRPNHGLDALSEDEIKEALVAWLESHGWSTQVAWGRTPGIDIDARRGGSRRVIEVKGPGSRPQMRVNYFLGILGETLQRMSDSDAEYYVALPDLPQFRGLWDRLPKLAKQRTGIHAIFVSTDKRVDLVN